MSDRFDTELVLTCPFCQEGHAIEDCEAAWDQRVKEEAAEHEHLAEAQVLAARIADWEAECDDALLAAQIEDAMTDPEGSGNDNTKTKRKSKAGEFLIGDQAEIADRLLAELKGDGPALVYDDGALHRYEPKDGLWRPVYEAVQSKVVQTFSGMSLADGKKSKTMRINYTDMRGAVRLAAHKMDTPNFFAAAPSRGVAFGNGFVIVSSKGIELREHSSGNRAKWGYTSDYCADATPTMFLKFLNSVFRDDADREAKIAFVQEFGGLSLLGLAPMFQKCLVASSFLHASTDGQNGKSQLAVIIKGAMPPGSITAIRPQEFENEYRRAALAGKLLNCVSEMPEGDILESASFKAIVTGDEIGGRHIREAPFDFTPRAGHYYACNTPPGTADFSKGFFRRFVFLTFSRVFHETDPDYVQDIGQKIVDAEKHLLPSWFLQGAVRALAQKQYTHIPSSDAAVLLWRKGIDQVELFFDEMTKPAKADRPGKESDWTLATSLYRIYRQWALDTGHAPLAANKFGARAAQSGRAPKHTKNGAFYPVKA